MPNKRLWVVLANSNTGPHEIDATDCINLAQFKEAIKKTYTPALDIIPSPALTLKTSDGVIILPNEFLNSAMHQNSYGSPFSIEITEFSIIPNATAFEVAKHIWKKNTGSYPALSLNKMSQLFEIPATYLKIAKLPCRESSLVLFCRQNFQEQFEFLDKQVIEKSRVGWILGPPGTGKSSAAFAFVTTLDKKEWIVTWLHCSDSELHLHCVKFTDDCIWTCEVNHSSVSLHDILYGFNTIKKHFVILDGYTETGKNNFEIMLTCQQWFGDYLLRNESQRRLLIVSSMAGRGKHNFAQDDSLGVNEFFAYSWTLQEYLMAVKYDNFLKNFKNYFNSITDFNSDGILLLEELVKSKFYYAGGNCRYMFMTSVAEVIYQIFESINQCDDVSLYINGTISDRSSRVINRLFSSYLVEGFRKHSLISDYAVSVVGEKVGPDMIQKFTEYLNANPSLNGWLLEEWFFSLLCHRDVNLYLQGEQLKKVTWCKCNKIHIFDPSKFSNEDLDICVNGAWLRPLKTNNPGYDAVYVNKNDGYVRFLQITRSKRHSFKILDFKPLLEKFGYYFHIKILEICFVIPIQKVNEFQIQKSQMTGMGQLKAYGWEKGKEMQKIKILGVYGWA